MKRILPLYGEIFRISMNSILATKLRSILTILIISLGIMALVGILTAIESIEGSLTNSFTSMGANTFTIQSRGTNVNIAGNRYRKKNYSYISLQQARQFKEDYRFPANVSISVYASGASTIRLSANATSSNKCWGRQYPVTW